MNLIALNDISVNWSKSFNKGNEKANTNSFDIILQKNIVQKKAPPNLTNISNIKSTTNVNTGKEISKSQVQKSDDKPADTIDVEDIEKKTLEKIAKAMGISEKELSDIMAFLNLNFIDLFSNDNLKELIKEAYTIISDIDFLTDSNAFTALKEVKQVLNDIFVNEDISFEEINQEYQKDISIYEEADVKNENHIVEEADINIKREPEPDRNVKIEIVDSRDKELSSNKDNINLEAKESKLEFADNITNNDSNENTGADTNTDKSKDSHISKENNISNDNNKFALPQTNVQTIETTSVNSLGEVIHEKITVKDIINQITTQVKIAFTNKATTISFQLQPENLGKIAFSVKSENGLMTGNIIAENNVVKEAIESNLSSLKINLSQQGINVEEIKVVVGNTSQFFEKSEQENSSNNFTKDRRRKNFGSENKDFEQKIDETKATLRSIDLDENINQVDYSV